MSQLAATAGHLLYFIHNTFHVLKEVAANETVQSVFSLSTASGANHGGISQRCIMDAVGEGTHLGTTRLRLKSSRIYTANSPPPEQRKSAPQQLLSSVNLPKQRISTSPAFNYLLLVLISGIGRVQIAKLTAPMPHVVQVHTTHLWPNTYLFPIRHRRGWLGQFGIF